MPTDFHWQVQEAKQRFSEVLRAAEGGRAQYVTRHGKEVAVVVSIDEFHRMVNRKARGAKYRDFNDWILNGPKLDLPDEEYDALFARSPETESSRETPFVGPEWE
ncbi:MAG TPA: type II toxin-antitoxin system Phd/YefM family antitoxin [Jatrophihabitans sp.]|nr:type II toxin-antitoxin system Phd/YefM family antitoxin [Jatrophihabitans sp.]